MSDPGTRAPQVGLCFRPKTAWPSATLNKTGKRSMVFRRELALKPLEVHAVKLPCSQCIGCRIMRSQHWAVRGVFESREHESSSYITLTYEDSELPMHGSLCKRDWQLFMKKLRKARPDVQLRYLYCGEYGPQRLRPHFHAAVFGLRLDDLEPWSEDQGIVTYTSEELAEIWGKGFVTVGEVNYQSLAYIARYIMKKAVGKHADEINPVTGLAPYEKLLEGGELVSILPEFNDMSRGTRCKEHRGLERRPKDCERCTGGLGYKWFDRYWSDFVQDGLVSVSPGRLAPAPAFFWKLLEKYEPELYAKAKAERIEYAKAHRFDEDRSLRRLRDRERVAEQYFSGMKDRGLRNPLRRSSDPIRAAASKARKAAFKVQDERLLRSLIK